MTKSIVCRCSEIILKSIDGEMKIRSRVILVRGGSVYAVCKGCNVEVRVPLVAAPMDHGPPLIVRK